MTTHIIEVHPQTGYVFREEIQHQDVYVALQIAKQRYPNAKYISRVGTKWTTHSKNFKTA